ncbi:MAG TPA: protein kinase [Polyangiaceae bacterium]|nr:protein kinase [Polyangiaceae bacterium]
MSSDHQCLSEDIVLTLVLGGFEESRACALLGEAEQCSDCSLLLHEAGQAIAEGESAGDASPWLSAADVLRVGGVIAARFRVLRLLGRGGMGEVYEALDGELGELVALKTIRTAHASLPSSVDRFRQEVRLARRVVHPNVCRVLEFGRHQAESGLPVYFLTMELLRGELLSRHLRRRVRLSTLESVAIVRQISAGLSAVHAQGVLHRDIKPANVMLCSTQGEGEPPGGAASRAVLLDFGVARSLARGSVALSNGALIGTPDYMAPEQLQSQALSPATDIYALGMVLFELLTGKLPFADDPTLTRALKRLQSSAPTPSTSPAELPPELVRLVARCLETDPRRRPQSAAELLNELAAFERDLSGPPSPSTPQSVGSDTGSTGAARVRFIVACAIVAGIGIVVALGARAASPKAAAVAALPGHAPARPASPPASARTKGPMPSAAEPTQDGVAALAHEQPVNQPAPPRVSEPSKVPSAPVRRASAADSARSPASAERPCSPPYYFDHDGFRVYRKECM